MCVPLLVVEGVAIVQQRSLGGGLHASLHARLHGGHGGHGIGQVLGQRHVLGLEVVQEVLSPWKQILQCNTGIFDTTLEQHCQSSVLISEVSC